MDLPSRFSEALLLLLQAHEYAQELRRPPLDFALEFEALRETGLNHNDCRWLVYQNILQHTVGDVVPQGEECPTSAPARLVLTGGSCFILTPHGLTLAQAVLGRRKPSIFPDATLAPEPAPPALAETPRWDRDCRELWVGTTLVKQFKVPAANQEIILQAFQEEDWPYCIDDPLPPHPSIDSKRRLHDTLGSLNRKQTQELIRFRGNGNGEGIRWEHVRGSGPARARSPERS